MIVRLIAVDPRGPGDRGSDLLVYQVPENSREHSFLLQLFGREGVEHTELRAQPRCRKADKEKADGNKAG